MRHAVAAAGAMAAAAAAASADSGDLQRRWRIRSNLLLMQKIQSKHLYVRGPPCMSETVLLRLLKEMEVAAAAKNCEVFAVAVWCMVVLAMDLERHHNTMTLTRFTDFAAELAGREV